MNRRRLSIALMIGTIAAIVLFQANWLRKNYEDEKKVLTLRTNLLFRETVLKLQATKLNLDINLKVSSQADERIGVVNLVNVLKRKGVPDSAGFSEWDSTGKDSAGRVHHPQSVIISLRTDKGDSVGKDSLPANMRYRLFNFLSGVDSLQQPLSVKEISALYTKALAKEGFHLPFQVISVDTGKRFGDFEPDSIGNRVTIGFSKPVEYRLEMGNTFWYMSRKVGPQLLFSLILVSCTILSFLLLYRNWQRQRRLTELKNDFISNISHELKTPIATVSVAVEAMRKFNALDDPARTREYLDISASELQRLSLLVDKVLKLSLFERQEIELKRDHFDLGILVEEVLASMRLQFEKYHATVVFTRGDEAGDYRLQADKLHVTSVLFNLLDNALKYSRHNPSIQVDLGYEQEAGLLVLSVTDNGLGIPAIYRERIFEKFFRVPTGDRHDVKGYGLGLSYVSYVVKRQGGQISVESQEGIGSRFTVKIPRSDG